MAAQHALGSSVHHQLDQGLLLAAVEGLLHGPEPGHVDVDLRVGGARLRLGKTHGPDGRLAEDRRGDGLVVKGSGLAIEFRPGEGGALADGHRRQVDAVCDVADGPDAGGGGL